MSLKTPDAYPDTRWSLILRLREPLDTPSRENVMREILGTYWQPLYASLRRSGLDADSAMEEIHDFVLHLAESDLLARADASRGRLRSLLWHTLKQYRIDRHRHRTRAKRGGRVPPLSLDALQGEEAHLATLDPALGPESTFDLRWAQAVLGRAWDRLRSENTDHAAFAALAPALAASPGVPLATLAEPTGLTPAAASAALYRWRRRLHDLVIEEISQTVGTRADLADEVRHFLRLLSG
jgi:hypothetical protein